MNHLFQAVIDWQRATFTESNSLAKFNHLVEELEELKANLEDPFPNRKYFENTDKLLVIEIENRIRRTRSEIQCCIGAYFYWDGKDPVKAKACFENISSFVMVNIARRYCIDLLK